MYFWHVKGILENFVVFEGGDGCGTSTQLDLLGRHFGKNGMSNPVFIPVYEPTDGRIGKIIRSALKKELIFQPDTLALLFAADRNEHLFAANGIVERCKRGELVVCDRYILSSLVYQGLECGDELPKSINSRFPLPQMLIFFDINPKTAQERLDSRKSLEIYEYPDFQIKVREKYLSLLNKFSDSGVIVTIIDASKSIEKVAEDVWRALEKMPILIKEK